MQIAKKNIREFNDDVKNNSGYLYTTHEALSSTLANKRISEAVAKYIGTDTKTLVDIGCGDGVYTAEIKHNFPRLEIEGFDPASEAIALAGEKYPDITFRVMNILDEDAGKREEKFDIGILRGVLHHLPDQELAIRNALAISRTLIIIEPNGNNPILKVIEQLSPYHRKHEEQSFSYSSLRDWTLVAPGEVLSHEYIGFIPFFFPTFLTKVIYFFQPFLERIPFVREFFSAQIVIVAKSRI